MDEDAYESYVDEAETWLKRGRLRLIGGLLDRHLGAPDGTRELLEIGAGTGQNVPVLAGYGAVDCLEISDQGLAALRERNDIRTIIDSPIPSELERRYDVLGAFDVLEHLEDDAGGARWAFQNLNEGGLFVATVPAYQALFCEHDVALHHHRRYTRRRLVDLVEPHGTVLQSGYFVSSLLPLAIATRLGSIVRYRRSPDSGLAEALKQPASTTSRLDSALAGILSGEAALIRRGIRLPMGLSTFVLARRTAR